MQHIARLDRQGRALFNRSYKAVGESGSTKTGAILGFLLTNRDPVGDRLIAAFNNRYAVQAADQRYSYFLFENTGGGEQQRFGIAGVDRKTGAEIGRLWVADRDPDFELNLATRTFYLQDKSNVIRAMRFDTTAN